MIVSRYFRVNLINFSWKTYVLIILEASFRHTVFGVNAQLYNSQFNCAIVTTYICLQIFSANVGETEWHLFCRTPDACTLAFCAPLSWWNWPPWLDKEQSFLERNTMLYFASIDCLRITDWIFYQRKTFFNDIHIVFQLGWKWENQY